jgi:hypothetical protein
VNTDDPRSPRELDELGVADAIAFGRVQINGV